jgi:hypothetical protein
MLGRARRAVLAVAGTAEGMFGGRSRHRTGDSPPSSRPVSPVRPEPTAGLPPRIDREPKVGLPPRIERAPTAGLPPRIERDATAGLPPRIEREPVAAPVPPPTRVEPEPKSEPVSQPVAEPAPKWEPPRTPRSPRRAGLRAHLWLTAIVLGVLVVGTGGYWVLRVHQRIGQAALQHELAKRESAPTVGCSKLQPDGAAWACAIVYQAESECIIAKVNVIGSWSTAIGQHRCAEIPALFNLLPAHTTAAGVAADIDRMTFKTGTQCLKVPQHQVRWACQQAPPTKACLVVRVQPWTPFNTNPGGQLCSKLPGLVKKVEAAGG